MNDVLIEKVRKAILNDPDISKDAKVLIGIKSIEQMDKLITRFKSRPDSHKQLIEMCKSYPAKSREEWQELVDFVS